MVSHALLGVAMLASGMRRRQPFSHPPKARAAGGRLRETWKVRLIALVLVVALVGCGSEADVVLCFAHSPPGRNDTIRCGPGAHATQLAAMYLEGWRLIDVESDAQGDWFLWLERNYSVRRALREASREH